MSKSTDNLQHNNLQKDTNNSTENQQLSTIARRNFLKKLGLGGVALASTASLSAKAALTEWNDGKVATLSNASTSLSLSSNNSPSISSNVSSNNNTSSYPNSVNAHNDNNQAWSEPAYNEQDYNNEYIEPQVTCASSTIAMRLFSSSNASSSDERNGLALERLRCAGFQVENPEVMNRKHYRFGGTDNQRANDFEAIAQGQVSAPKLLLGVRGGYGAMRLLEKVSWNRLGDVLRERGTIVGGFSDVTALQCALLAKGRMSSSNIPMAYSEFGKYKPDPISCAGFVKAVSKNLVLHTFDSSRTSAELPTILGTANRRVSGTIWGGNLSVLSSLSGSDYLPKPRGGIVFIEEVGEQPYRLERMLYDMYLAGAFKGQQAIVFGAMARSGTDGYDPSYNVAAVIRELHRITGLPIYSGVGFGHVSKKQSFPMGCHCELIATGSGFDMQFSGYPTIEQGLIYEPALSMDI